jgi:hypothetical protein
MTRLREGLIDDPAAWATLRRRVLTKAVEYSEVTLTRLRARLDELPPAPNGQYSNGSAQRGSRTSEPAPPPAVGPPPPPPPVGPPPPPPAVGPPPPPPAVGPAPPEPSVGPPPPPPSVGPALPGPTISPWVPHEVAEAHPQPAEPMRKWATRRRSAHAAARAHPASAQSSMPGAKPARTRRRTVIVALVVSIVLLAAAAAGALLYFHPWHSTSPAPAPPATATRAFSLPALRHNRPRRFSIVLTRMGLVTRESVDRMATGG